MTDQNCLLQLCAFLFRSIRSDSRRLDESFSPLDLSRSCRKIYGHVCRWHGDWWGWESLPDDLQRDLCFQPQGSLNLKIVFCFVGPLPRKWLLLESKLQVFPDQTSKRLKTTLCKATSRCKWVLSLHKPEPNEMHSFHESLTWKVNNFGLWSLRASPTICSPSQMIFCWAPPKRAMPSQWIEPPGRPAQSVCWGLFVGSNMAKNDFLRSSLFVFLVFLWVLVCISCLLDVSWGLYDDVILLVFQTLNLVVRWFQRHCLGSFTRGFAGLSGNSMGEDFGQWVSGK